MLRAHHTLYPSRPVEHLNDESLIKGEIEAPRQIAKDNRNRGIADKLSISEETVNVHIK